MSPAGGQNGSKQKARGDPGLLSYATRKARVI